MSNTSETIVATCVQYTLSAVRTRPDLRLAPESYWLYGIQHTWHQLFWDAQTGEYVKYLSVGELNDCLVKLGVPPSSFKKLGKHTMVELDNISFVYRDKQFKYVDAPLLQVAPHIKG